MKVRPGAPQVLWRQRALANHVSSCVLYRGHVYGFHGQVGGRGVLTCLDAGNGNVLWTQRGMGTGSLMAAGGKLIIMSERGELIVARASPARFEMLARARVLRGTCWTMPVLAGGRIYCRSARGMLVCLDVSAGAPRPLAGGPARSGR